MSPELVSEIKAKIAEWEPVERKFHAEMTALDAQLKELAKPYERARDAWCKIYCELGNLKAMLPPEQRSEQPAEKPLPF